MLSCFFAIVLPQMAKLCASTMVAEFEVMHVLKGCGFFAEFSVYNLCRILHPLRACLNNIELSSCDLWNLHCVNLQMFC